MPDPNPTSPALLDAALQRDIQNIRQNVLNMGALAEEALKTCLQALLEKSRQKAYTVILRDQRIDELEKEIDQLCLEFLVRQQPVAGHLRFAYATIKINAELERIGDYAESIARQVLKVASLPNLPATDKFIEIANHSIPMLHAAIEAFVKQDAALARRTMVIEERVDELRSELNRLIIGAEKAGSIPLEALTPLLTVARRYERVSDQARNICEETLYMCTGEFIKHRGGNEPLRVLFVDEHHGCRSRMAESIGRSLGQSQLLFLSAGLDPRPADEAVSRALAAKGMETPAGDLQPVRTLLEETRVQVIVALDWTVPDPSAVRDASAAEAAYEQTFQNLRIQVTDLARALLGE
ncbi:MAG: phosphate signaling complex protein PhoU [Desulfobacterales bacterium]|nr:phosphate signaling complex protein PhoU [Desulfobacterales bacterium]